MTDESPRGRRRRLSGPLLGFLALTLVAIVAAMLLIVYGRHNAAADGGAGTLSSQSKNRRTVFFPTPAQLAALTIQTIEQHPFRTELVTDGRIAIDEDHSTPVFSPYSGQVKRLAAKPGDPVARGQLLFTIEATDMVQAQNDFITALAGLETAKSQLNLAQINEKRQHDLYEAKAVPLKDWQQSQADLIAAQSNLRTAEIALEAVRNRLRILRKTEEEIAEFQKTGKINPDTPIYSPLAGTVVQRKVGPGQYITSGASDPTGDPVFVIGDLSTVWVVANVRETDALNVRLGQAIEFKLLSSRDQVFSSTINYAAAVMDPNTRRLLVRATVDNPDKLLKPEMFARVTIFTSDAKISPAVLREAIIYEGDLARVWVAADDKSLELRRVTTGLISGNLVQITSGLAPGDRVVTRGTLFIDRAASGNET